MNWFGLLSRNLLRRPGRSIFTLLGVALAVGSFLALASLSTGMKDSSKATLAERGIDLMVIKRGMVEVFGGSLPETLGERIRQVPGVGDVAGELNTILQMDDDTHIIVTGWSEQEFMFRELKLLRGRIPEAGEGAVIAGDVLADARHLDVGSDISLDFSPFKVVGVAQFSSSLLRGTVVMPLPQMQQLLARPAQVTLFQVRLTKGQSRTDFEATEARVSALAPDILVLTGDQALQGSQAMTMLSQSSLAIAIVALLMACLSVLNTLAMSVEERTREIGILSAIGWPPLRILALIMSEGVLLAAVGGVLGIGLGMIGDQLLMALVLPGSGMTAAATFNIMAIGLATALGVGAVGALWPAWRASRMAPAAALRQQ